MLGVAHLKYAIRDIRAREILDSRGNPTIEVDVLIDGGSVGTAAVPSGASTGIYEAVELRDGDSRYHGKGVLKAVELIKSKIYPALKGMNVRDQTSIDKTLIDLDGTENKSNLGGNTILGVSIACIRAASISDGLRLYEYINREASLLPVPFLNLINGGKHAGNQLDFQEFMIAPTGAPSFREAMRYGSEVYQTIKKQLQEKYGKGAINVGDEGGFAPPFKTPQEGLDALSFGIEESGYVKEVKMALDVAASTFFRSGFYEIAGKRYSTDEMIEFYRELISKYPIVSLEDPLEEDDYNGFAKLTRALKIQVVGDDLFVTNLSRFRKGIDIRAANALLLKVNQVGTLTEALEAAKMARDNGYAVMASHRSGDTEDPWVADLSVGIGSGQIKSGAPARGERTAKYNQLLRIEEWLGEKARYPRLF